MPEAPPPRGPAGPGTRSDAQPLCAGAELAERGRALLFDVLLWGQPARAFALRYEGRVVAYINRCAHVPVEMDWQPGEFLDMDKRWIVCSIHGASYEPLGGHCVAGPCGRGRLLPLEVQEAGGRVYWYPSRDIRPVVFDEPAAHSGPFLPQADPGPDGRP